MTSTKQTLVLSVIEGQNFVKRSDFVYVQCKFNKEILTTDPVPQTTTPIFDTILSWNMQHKQLSYFRSQRAKLKIMVYTINAANQREEIGFLVLDLRAAATGTPPYPEKWYPLINVKSTSPFRPELKLSFAVSNERESITFMQERKPVESHLKLKNTSTPKFQQPVSLPESPVLSQPYFHQSTIPVSFLNGYYQVGQYDSSQQFFTLWITISFAEYLTVLDQSPGEFYFYYQFFGIDIKTRPFVTLDTPNFPAERVSIQVHAFSRELSTLLSQLQKLVVYLCNREQVIGVCEIPLTILSVKVVKMDFAVEESIYPLHTPDMQVRVDAQGNVPAIGVSLALSLGQNPMSSPKPKVTSTMEATTEPIVMPAKVVKVNTAIEATTEPIGIPANVVNVEKMQDKIQTEIPKLDKKEEAVNTEPQESVQKDIPKKTIQSFVVQDIVVEEHQYDESPYPEPSEVGHQFRVSVELRSIQNFKLKSATIFFKYTYSPFGTSSPVITHPALPAMQSTSELLLEHSFCAFEFVMPSSRLWDYFDTVPLDIEMWHKDENMHHVLLGRCTLILAELHRCKEKVMGDVTTRLFDCWSPVVASAQVKKYSTVCELRSLICLEDFGSVRDSGVETPRPQMDPAIEMEYETALELELWREEKKKEYLKQMELKEVELEQKYEREFRERDEKRQRELDEKLKEYQDMLSKLEELSHHLDHREFVVSSKEREIAGREGDLQAQKQRHEKDFEEMTRRFQESFEESNQSVKKRLADAEHNVLLANKERDQYRQKFLELEMSRNQYDAKAIDYQREIDMLRSTNKELEQKCLRLTQSRHELKKKYKGLFDVYQKTKSFIQDKHLLQDVDKENLDLSTVKSEMVSLKLKVLDPQVKAEVERLKKEKAMLLENGYDETDQILVALDQKINSLT